MSMGTRTRRSGLFLLIAVILILSTMSAGLAAPTVEWAAPEAKFSTAVAFDVSRPLSEVAKTAALTQTTMAASADLVDIRPDRGVVVQDMGYTGDAALQGALALPSAAQSITTATIPGTMANFEGLSNEDNFALFGFRVNPPDPVGDVGRFHYVEMINLAIGVYDKQGNLLMGPLPIGALWEGFAVEDCTDPSGDPIVLYDQLVNRWILSQFTTRFTPDPQNDMFYNCVAVSKTPDPTGEYYRYAFPTGNFFPDYPKYGVWTDSYLLTSRDFGPTVEYGISVYALEKAKMISGQPDARAVQFFLDYQEVPLYLIGDGLLPADIDGNRRPQARVPAPIVGTMDDDYGYGAPFDAMNIFELSVQWNSKAEASLEFVGSFPVAAFDSVFPCAPTSRDCLPQPGITNPAQFLDVLSYRQRPTHRLAYRNFGVHEAMVTNQSVEALPGVAGIRWYEIRRIDGDYYIYQQGTYAPDDGVHRWMGSIAMDQLGNIALGYSVVNGVDVYPGIRYTGRLAGDPIGNMTLAEGVIINGTGVQTTTNSRWGDYSSMNVDLVDDCTFWYVNEYYEISGFPVNPDAPTTAPWQTRIASFKLPGCPR